ncbi:MAG: TRAP transporter substrate-binding protein DctP [Desulfatiglandales bacterium]
MNKKNLVLSILVFSVFWISAFPCRLAEAAGPLIIKFATLAPEGSTWMKHMRRLDNRIRDKSQGQIGFRIYAGGIAGDELDVLKKLRIGQIHCAAFSGVGFGQILPMVRVLDLPFLFRDYTETDLVHTSLEGFFSERFREKGFELLAWAEVGNIHLFSQKPIQRVEDLSGLKVWTWSGDPISKETFTIMGTLPIPLSVTDVLTALNTGMIDTVYAPPLGALALQWHRSVKYMTSLPLAHSTGALLLSNNIGSKIPGPLLEMLKSESEKAMRDLIGDLRNQAEQAVKIIEEGGLTVLPMPEESGLENFYEIHEQVAKNLSGRVYPPELLDRVYGILQKVR